MMKDLENMKEIWLNQPDTQKPLPDARKTMTMSSSLEKQLNLFDQEHGYKSFLLAGIVTSLMGAAFLILVFKQQSLTGLVGLAGFWGSAGLFFWYYFRCKNLIKGIPGDSAYHYVKAKYHQLDLFFRIRVLRIVLMFLIGFGFFMLDVDLSFQEIDPQTAGGILGFLLVAVFLGLLLNWWYKHHHPYRPNQLKRDLKQLLEEFEEDPSLSMD